MSKKDLEFFGNKKIKISLEGVGYYLTDYAPYDSFKDYPDVNEIFLKAKKYVREFEETIDKKIEDNGGDPEDFIA